MAKWFYLDNGKPMGPFKQELIVKKIRAKELSVFDMVYPDGQETWKSILEYKEFQFLVDELDIHVDDTRNTHELQWILLIKKPPHRGEGFNQSGPFTTKEVQDKIEEGDVRLKDLIWCEGMPQWARVSEINNFSIADFDEKVPPIQPPLNPKVSESKVVKDEETDFDDFEKLSLSQSSSTELADSEKGDKLDEDKGFSKKSRSDSLHAPHLPPSTPATSSGAENSVVSKNISKKKKTTSRPNVAIKETDKNDKHIKKKVVSSEPKDNSDEKKKNQKIKNPAISRPVKIDGPEYVSKEDPSEVPPEAEGQDLVREKIRKDLFKQTPEVTKIESKTDVPQKEVHAKKKDAKLNLKKRPLPRNEKRENNDADLLDRTLTRLDGYVQNIGEEIIDLPTSLKINLIDNQNWKYLGFSLSLFVFSFVVFLNYEKVSEKLNIQKFTSVFNSSEKIEKKNKKSKSVSSPKKSAKTRGRSNSKRRSEQEGKSEAISKPQVRPTQLSYWYIASSHQFMVSTNGSHHFPLHIRIKSRVDKTLNVAPVRRSFPLTKNPGVKEFVLNLKANGIPQGTYKVSLKSDKLEKEYVVLLAKNNRAFKQSLWKFKKKSSYYVTTEKRNLFNKSEKVEGQARELKKYYLKLHKNKKAWRKFYKSWSGNFKHSYANEFASPSKYYFSDWWKELKEIRAELRKESRTINKNINKGAVSTHVLTKQISSISLLQNKITGRRL